MILNIHIDMNLGRQKKELPLEISVFGQDKMLPSSVCGPGRLAPSREWASVAVAVGNVNTRGRAPLPEPLQALRPL